MTFKGMLKILIKDYRKQHEERMYSIVQELMKTKHELNEVTERLNNLQVTDTISTSDNSHTSIPTINLYVRYNGFFNQLCSIQQSMTIKELLVKLRRLTGIPDERLIRLRILSKDGHTTICFLHKDPNRTLESYRTILKPQMILNIEDSDDDDHHNEKHIQRSRSTTSSEKAYSFDESDV